MYQAKVIGMLSKAGKSPALWNSQAGEGSRQTYTRGLVKTMKEACSEAAMSRSGWKHRLGLSVLMQNWGLTLHTLESH